MNLVVMMAVVALILIGVAVAVANADVGMPEAPRDLPDTGIPVGRPMEPADVDALRFSTALRGYRMAEVDEAMERLRTELENRDAEIERLRNPTVDDPDEVERLDEILERDAESDALSSEPDVAGDDRADGTPRMIDSTPGGTAAAEIGVPDSRG